MNSLLSIILLLNIQFKNEYYYEIERSVEIQKKIFSLFKERIEVFDGDYQLCSAIIFPEILRYSFIKGKIENSIVKTFYISYGSAVSDFSIGLFQMKPSFVERLEKEVVKYQELEKFLFINEFPNTLDVKKKRSLRFDRITDLKWQIDYLICFTKLLDLAFLENDTFNLNNKNDKIALYSSAYNSGHWFDLKKIKYYQNKNFFPGGIKSYFNKYNYSDISVYFHKTFLYNINN